MPNYLVCTNYLKKIKPDGQVILLGWQMRDSLSNFFMGVQSGKASVGGEKKRFRDSLKENLISLNIGPRTWENVVQDRTKWRSLISTRCAACKKGADRSSKGQAKKTERKREHEEFLQVQCVWKNIYG